MINDPNAPHAFKLPDAARYVGLSPEYLSREIREGRLGVVRFGRRITIPRESLIAWYNLRSAQGESGRG